VSERISYGAERRYRERAPGYREQLPPPTGPCHDCAVRPGELHQEGCDWEECETCGGQRISCCCCTVCRAHEKDGTWSVCQRCIDLAQRALSGGAALPREPSPAAIDALLIKARTQTILGDVVKWYMADDASEEARRALLRDVIERVRALLDDLRRTP